MRKMKDSGLEWIGEIPSQWSIKRIKNIGTARNGLTYTPNDVCDNGEGTLVLRSSNVKNGKISLDDNVYVSSKVPAKLKVKKGDILICSRNGSRELVGKNALIDDVDATYGAFMMVFRCKCPRFMFYVLNSNVFAYYLGGFATSTINQLTGADFGNMKVAYCPDVDEQNRIVNFLDAKCADIDQIREDIDKQIEILTDYKKSIITEAVTKGLDPKAKMKDSGIEWIGKIPEHWTLTKIGSVYSLRSEKVSDKVFAPLSVTKNGILPQLESVAKTDDGDNRKLVRKGDFVINSRSDRRGSCGISYLDGSVSLINTVLKPRNEMNPRYYNWLFHTELFADEFYSWGHGIVDDLWTTRWQEMKNILIPVPTSIEQKAIASYLDEKCSEIDATIAEKQKQLETLEEYKKSLIFEYVTGKKEVV